MYFTDNCIYGSVYFLRFPMTMSWPCDSVDAVCDSFAFLWFDWRIGLCFWPPSLTRLVDDFTAVQLNILSLSFIWLGWCFCDCTDKHFSSFMHMTWLTYLGLHGYDSVTLLELWSSSLSCFVYYMIDCIVYHTSHFPHMTWLKFLWLRIYATSLKRTVAWEFFSCGLLWIYSSVYMGLDFKALTILISVSDSRVILFFRWLPSAGNSRNSRFQV